MHVLTQHRGFEEELEAAEEKIAAYLEQVRRARETSLDMLMHEVTSDLGQDALDYLKPKVHLGKRG